MSFPVLPHGFLGAQGDSDTYRIERSLRFNSADSAYLSRTFASPTSSSVFTFSTWLKRSSLGSIQGIFATNPQNLIYIGSDDKIYVAHNNVDRLITSAVFRDISAWYHLVYQQNGTSITLYINGQSNSTATGSPFNLNTAIAHFIGSASAVSAYFSGYLTEINFIDGQALTPSSFGETDAITGRWKAKAYSGTYGTNGFYLSFKNNSNASSLGQDQAYVDGVKAQNNFWTTNNFSVTAGAGNDSLVDSPTNYGTDTGLGGEVRGNYCTLNPLITGGGTFSNGNLDLTTGLATSSSFGSIKIPDSGKWYWEFTPTSNAAYSFCGISVIPPASSTYVVYYGDGQKYIDGTNTNYGASYTNNDVIGVAVNSDSGVVTFYKNGASQGDITYSISNKNLFPYFADGSGSFSVTLSVNFGQRPFAYTAPSGFKALCTQNLPQPTIQKPSTAMDVVTYTGTGASQSISSLGFSPDLVWIKGRSGATDHTLYDVIRGSQARLESNTTDAEVTSDNGLTSFDSAGFTVGTLAQVNTNTSTYVGWSWDAGSTNSTNTSGSITSTVRANPQAGFSIVSWQMSNIGTNYTVGHGLGVTPSLVIVKNRSASLDWNVWHNKFSNLTDNYLLLNSTAAVASNSSNWGLGMTASVIGVRGAAFTNGSNQNLIAYCFAEIEGYSKFGSYTGNGSSDGPFVWCGFRPRWVILKRTDSTNNWIILDTLRDTFNSSRYQLLPNVSDAEYTIAETADMLSSGFKIRDTNASRNASGGTYIFAAFAEAPFKYARAR